jgi:hypothetical protein
MLVLKRRGRRNPEAWRFALRCFGCVIIGCVVWGLLIIGPPGPVTINHQGAYTLPILALAGCVTGLYAVSPQLAGWFVAFHSLTGLLLYVPVLDPPPGAIVSRVSAAAALAALICFAVVAFRAAHQEGAGSWLSPPATALGPGRCP